jgi:hypothetical protein
MFSLAFVDDLLEELGLLCEFGGGFGVCAVVCLIANSLIDLHLCQLLIELFSLLFGLLYFLFHEPNFQQQLFLILIQRLHVPFHLIILLTDIHSPFHFPFKLPFNPQLFLHNLPLQHILIPFRPDFNKLQLRIKQLLFKLVQLP